MIPYRGGLDEHIDAKIVEVVLKIANGGSFNSALRFYLRFLHYQFECQKVTLEGQDTSINLNSLDEVFSGLEE